MFDAIGGKTKVFAAVWAIVQALEVADVIPAGSVDTAAKLLEVLAQAGVLWGLRDAVAKIKA